MIKKNGTALTRFLDKLAEVKTPEDEYNYFLMSKKKWEEMEQADYGIYQKETGNFIGACGIFNIDYEKQSAEFGFWLTQDMYGNGYMTEAVKTMEADLFSRGFNRLVIIMDCENIASENVAKRCGFSHEGNMREWHYNFVLKSYRNMHIYSKLKKEWNNK